MVDKKDQILETATELFASNGFDGTSIRDISNGAGVNVAMVNYYFGSKEKLYTAIIESKIAYNHERLVKIAADDSLDEMQKMEAVARLYVDRIISFPSLHRILQLELILALRTEIQEMLTDIFKKNTAIVKDIIDQGMAKGIFKPVDGPLVMATIIGTINQVMGSKRVCLAYLNKGDDIDPYQDKEFKDRVLNHIIQIMRSYLLK